MQRGHLFGVKALFFGAFPALFQPRQIRTVRAGFDPPSAGMV
jgi:hypothetical protein